MVNEALKIRPANISDAEQVFLWRNDPKVHKYFFDANPISWDAHKKWFDNYIQSENHMMLIASIEDEEIGVVRFNNISEPSVEVDIYLAAKFHGKGYGKIMLHNAVKWAKKNLKIRSILAKIMTDNTASEKIFLGEGFTKLYSVYTLDNIS